MDGTKECRTLSCSNYCFLLNHEILLESHDYFLFTCFALRSPSHALRVLDEVGLVCVFTYQLPIYIGIDAYNCLFCMSKFFRRLSYQFFGTHRHAEVHEVNEGGSTPCLLRSTSGASKANAGEMVGTV